MLPISDPEQTESRHLLNAVPLVGKRVLEIGCGDGRLTWRYAHSARNVVGIDLNQIDLRAAHIGCPPELRSSVRFVLADARALPFSDGLFDAALFSWSF